MAHDHATGSGTVDGGIVDAVTGRKSRNFLIKLSKSLSYILRHGAKKQGFVITDDGFIDVDSILCHRQFKRYTEDDIQEVVETNEKQRFALRKHPINQQLQIRANQGHSFDVCKLELTQINSVDDAPVVVHGTYLKTWVDFISKEGLNKMKRSYIHFAAGVPGDDKVISGARSNVQVLIFIDISTALADGFLFYKSTNNVILCPGDQNGLLAVKYFKKVVQCKPIHRILYEDGLYVTAE